MLPDIGLLILRVVVGLLLAGHGAQKLFGWFGGPGINGFAGGLVKMGVWPPSFWARVGGLAEFGGGVLFALGFLEPIGPIGIIAAMLTAIALVHWGKGIWSSKGGSEFPLTNIVVAVAVLFTGSGAYSLDRLLSIALPEKTSLIIGGLIISVLGVVLVLLSKRHKVSASAQPKAT